MTDWRAAGAKLAREAAERQGLPDKAECPITLRNIAILAGLTSRRRRTPPHGDVP